jgi:hypothetical protein
MHLSSDAYTGGRTVKPTPMQVTAATASFQDTPIRKTGAATGELTPAQQRRVDELKQIDRNVRAHEAAHMAAGQGLVTHGATYGYIYGPDGKRYAVSGEVGIDTSPEKTPEANLDKGRRIRAAALAPRDPSPQDYRVASVGSQLENRGRAEQTRERLDQTYGKNSATTAPQPAISVFA